MASRQEEKERRRREREEAERAAQRAEARRKRIGMILGGVLVAALIAVGVLAFASGGDGGDDRGLGAQGGAPAFGETDLDAAAEAAGCELRSPEDEGSNHTSEDVTYESNPPASGDHDPGVAQDGVYPEPPDVGETLHALEHGRIAFQYRPGSPGQRVAQLEAMVNEELKGTEGYKSLLFENQTEMQPAVAATAWPKDDPQVLACPAWNDRVFDALRAFRLEYVDKAAEFHP